MTLTKQTSWKVIARDTLDFNLTDERRRSIGGWWQIAAATYSPTDEPGYGCIRAPGTYFEARYSATRNNEPFGSSNGSEFFATEDEALRHVLKKLEATRKRYARKYGRPEQVA